MNAIRKLWLMVPRKLRVFINIIFTLFLIFCLYVFVGAPAFGSENQYRRTEKANLVGPAEILGTLKLPNSAYDRVILADDGDGAIIYAWDTDDEYSPKFLYREKTDGALVMAVPNTDDSWLNYTKVQMSIIAFADVPDAQYAELELTLSSQLNGVSFEQDYLLRSTREIPGAFCFFLTANKEDDMTPEMLAVQIFELVSGYGGQTYAEVTYPAQLRFFDSENELIETKDIVIRSVSADAAGHE